MAECVDCGQKAGAFKDVCLRCEGIRAEKVAEREREIAARDKAATEQKLRNWEDAFQEGLAQGKEAYAYRALYVSIDSVINNDITGDFNIAGVQQLGLWGWQVVAVLPRTIGLALTNISYGASSGETWGAGMGGNVEGVYLLMCKKVDANDPESLDEARSIGEALINDGLKL